MIKLKVIIVTVFLCTVFFSSQANATPINDSCRRLILTLLAPNIQSQIENYYSSKITVIPNFAPFLGGNSVDIEIFESHIDVVVTVIPYVGPHIDVGEDKMRFRIDNTGKVLVISYEHIKNYKLPSNWTHIIR